MIGPRHGVCWFPPARLHHRLLAVALVAAMHVHDVLDTVDVLDNLTVLI